MENVLPSDLEPNMEIPALKEMAAIKFAKMLWSSEVVTNYKLPISKFTKKTSRELLGQMDAFIDGLKLSYLDRVAMKRAIRFLQMPITNYFKQIFDLNLLKNPVHPLEYVRKRFRDIVHVGQFCWKTRDPIAAPTIDVKETLTKYFFRNNSIDSEVRCAYACILCYEDIIYELYQNCYQPLVHDLLRSDFRDEQAIAWIKRYWRKAFKLQQGDFDCSYEYIIDFILAIVEYKPFIPVDYFFNLLGNDERDEMLSKIPTPAPYSAMGRFKLEDQTDDDVETLMKEFGAHPFILEDAMEDPNFANDFPMLISILFGPMSAQYTDEMFGILICQIFGCRVSVCCDIYHEIFIKFLLESKEFQEILARNESLSKFVNALCGHWRSGGNMNVGYLMESIARPHGFGIVTVLKSIPYELDNIFLLE